MITVRITNNGIRMDGHAGHHINGQDIVCSAISALTCTLIMGLQELTDNRIRADTGGTGEGMANIYWGELDKDGRLLVDTWYLGLMALNVQYNCIRRTMAVRLPLSGFFVIIF